MGGIIHVVMIKFKPDVGDKVIEDAVSSLGGLKDNCLDPNTQKPYIKSVTGGSDVSIEGLQNGFTHMFVTEFESVEDRDYYAKKDPVHLALASSLPPNVAGIQVLDIAS